MPIKIPDNLPAVEVLNNENIFVMTENRAIHQDIRPLKIAILNLMPLKIETENQLLRLLSNTPLQVEVDLIHTSTYLSKHTSLDHLKSFYKTFDDISHSNYDGLVITGAPIEHLKFEEVRYWNEIEKIMEWSKYHVTSTLHICWAALAGLYYHFGVPKHNAKKKISGVFKHIICKKNVNLLRGFDDEFLVPHSRNAEVFRKDIEGIDELEILAESKESGVYIVKSKGGKQIFITGHSEYDPNTLKKEYERDISKGLDIPMPVNYFPDNNPNKKPNVLWRAHSHLLFSNWLNYYVYQVTPYNLNEIK